MDNFLNKNQNFEVNNNCFELFIEKGIKQENYLFSHKNNFISDRNYNNGLENDALEIKKIIEGLDQIIHINISRVSYDEYDRYINHIKLSLYDDNNKCQKELLTILKKPLSDKNIRNKGLIFKPLIKSKKVSLIGKVFGDIPSNDTTENSSITINETNNY